VRVARLDPGSMFAVDVDGEVVTYRATFAGAERAAEQVGGVVRPLNNDECKAVGLAPGVARCLCGMAAAKSTRYR
jgi:hypothetical protein